MASVALNTRLSTWLLTTGVEDFERASDRKDVTSNTAYELMILILSISVTFSLTLVLFNYYLITSFIQKACLQCRHLHPHLFYKVG